MNKEKILLEDFLNFIRDEYKRIEKHLGMIDPTMRTYTCTIKIAEEFGELCSEVWR